MEFQSYLAFMKKSESVYQKYCQSVIREWDINDTAFQVLMFLSNHPRFNTARDVCRMRGIKTGIVSVAVEQLIQMGYLERKTDPNDRRIQRLYVTGQAAELVLQGREVQQEFGKAITEALSPDELEEYFRLTEKMRARIDELERSL